MRSTGNEEEKIGVAKCSGGMVLVTTDVAQRRRVPFHVNESAAVVSTRVPAASSSSSCRRCAKVTGWATGEVAACRRRAGRERARSPHSARGENIVSSVCVCVCVFFLLNCVGD